MIKNIRTKCEGENLISRMSDPARRYYDETDGIIVWAESSSDDECEVSYDFGQTSGRVKFEKLEEDFIQYGIELDSDMFD